MLEVHYDLKHAVIDVRKKVPNKKDPKEEIFYFAECLPINTVVEIHAEDYDIHFISKLETILGMNIFVNELGPKHFRYMGAKLI